MGSIMRPPRYGEGFRNHRVFGDFWNAKRGWRPASMRLLSKVD